MKKMITVSLALVTLVGASLWALTRSKSEPSSAYRFATIDRGHVESVVSATGTLSAVTTVEVGTQVSGIVSSILVDFNDKVKKGQAIARIDPTLLEIAVRNAEANLERNQAQLNQAERDYRRAVTLREERILSETDYNAAQYNLETGRATVKGAQVGLEQAQRNLAYATIYAPVAGTVVERTVDVGQTVAASLATPKLFTIAEDLTRMQMLTSVDESDIGRIRAGQSVRFTVQAYPGEAFTGAVRQVRLQSQTKENVVNYTVVVDVRNEDARLLPGMTATARFVVARVDGVLRVPNAALRIVPSEQMKVQLAATQASPDGGGRLFTLDEQGRLALARVRSGLSDGQFTEVEGPALAEGLRVIAGLNASAPVAATSNPLQGNSRQQQSGPPGPGF